MPADIKAIGRARYNRRQAEESKQARAKFLETYAATRDLDKALASVGRTARTVESWCQKWPDFRAAWRAMRAADRGRSYTTKGENMVGSHSVEWNGQFADFARVFLGRISPWFHLQLFDAMRKLEGGDIMLVIWPPEHGKTSIMEDYSTFRVATDPTFRITVGKGKIDFAQKFVETVKNRLEPNIKEYWRLRERFGPFSPLAGRNEAGQPQVWTKDGFNVFKRRLGSERDYNMQALGIGAEVAGTRTDQLLCDDVQSRKTLSQTDKILETMRDDWFSRPGVTGNTIILMNVVGDDDIGERLYNENVCDHVTILKAFDESYLELGPRATAENTELWEPSPWLWPERYSPKNYERLRRNAGPEGWARKYQQDWRPAISRTFIQDHWDRCQNPLRRLDDPAPAHPAGDREAEIAISLDPGFGRACVGAAAFEPTRMVVLDSYAERNIRRTSQMIDLVAAQCRHWHRPSHATIRWVIVEGKAMAKGLLTDDMMLELQMEYGFEIVDQQTGWDKHDEDFGVAQMGRSMERAELDFPAGDKESVARFDTLRRELLDWRPEIRAKNRGNKRQQDEVMTLWFNWTRWHKLRRKSIRRPTDAAQFGFGGIPLLPGQRPRPVALDLSSWNFGRLPIAR